MKTTICNKCFYNINSDEYATHYINCNNNNDFKQSLKSSNKFSEGGYNSTSDFNKLNANNYFSTTKPAQKEKNEVDSNYITLNEGAITFGARNNIISDGSISLATNKNNFMSTYLKTNNYENDFTISLFGIRNTIFEYNSYLTCVIHTLWNMKNLREYILYDLVLNEKEAKHNLLNSLQNLFKKINTLIGRNREIISIDDLRKTLNDCFQSKRKFLIDYPDDPIDAFFAFTNAFHSYYIVNTF
jgi:hypothetical protein